MGSSGQLYSLSWGEFSSSLASAVQLLRGHGDLVDVTLAAGGRSFPAHKIVLCAASPFLLDSKVHCPQSTPCQHPVVMLAGIGADDLESLLEFVYRGEVSVEPAQLPSLLQAAHCLCIHGLTPPTILTESGEEVPASAIPTATNDGLSRAAAVNSYYPLKRRKKRRKSSSSSGKWQCTSNTTDSESRPLDDNRTMPYESKDDEPMDQTDDAAGNCLVGNTNNHQGGSPRLEDPSVADNHQAAHQDHVSDGESHLHTLMPMQFSPLHIPQFHSTMGFPSGLALSGLATTQTSGGANQSKARGASDCPGVCPLCGATLRQARNLRRHLLSSCKYRFNNSTATTMAAMTAMQNSDSTLPEIKQEVEVPGYDQSVTYGTDSGSNDCEQIVCNPILPSPTSHEPESVVSSPNSIPSPTIAR